MRRVEKTISTGVGAHRLSSKEQRDFERDGYVVRPAVFTRDECASIIEACEALTAEVVSAANGRRYKVGSYVFEPNALDGVTVKWEGDTDAVHGLEPFAHLSPTLCAWAHDARFIDPMIDLVQDPEPTLFTEKLNLKRPRLGGPNPLHQDYPYWRDFAPNAARIATAILYLDDATLENGCLQVVPGSHRDGQHPTRSDSDLFGNLEMDPVANQAMQPVAVEVPAGSIVMFGAFLAHMTGPNTSELDRRALLFSYQEAGATHSLEYLRRIMRGETPTS